MASKHPDEELIVQAASSVLEARSPDVINSEIQEAINKLSEILYDATRKNTKPVDPKKFIKNYCKAVNGVVQHKFKPWIQKVFPTLPKVNEDSFYELVFTRKDLKNLKMSPFCTTEFQLVKLNDFVMQNVMVAIILLLMHLTDLHMENESYTLADETSNMATELVMKYARVLKFSFRSENFAFIVHTYTVPSKFTIDREDRLESASLKKEYVTMVYSSIRSAYIEKMYPDIHSGGSLNIMACQMVTHFMDWHLFWMALNATVFVFYPPYDVEPDNYGFGVTPSADHLRILNSNIRIYLNMGDHFMCAVHCWVLARCYFLLSLLEEKHYASELVNATLKLIVTAERLSTIAFFYGEEIESFTKKLCDQGSVVKALPYSWDTPGVYENESLIKDIIQLLAEKRCHRDLARRITLPLLVIAARYNRLPKLPPHIARPKRKEYLDILLVIRMLYPPMTTFALNVYAFEHRRVKYQQD